MNPHSLLLPTPERQQHSVSGVDTSVVIGLSLWGHAGRKLWVAADVQQSTHGRGYDVGGAKVAVRTALSKTGKGQENQFRILFCQDGVTKPQFLQMTRIIAFQNYIGSLYQFEKKLASCRLAHIQGDALLPGVQVSKAKTAFQVNLPLRKRGLTAQAIPARELNLDHLQPQVPEELTAKRPHCIAEVENPVAGKKRPG